MAIPEGGREMRKGKLTRVVLTFWLGAIQELSAQSKRCTGILKATLPSFMSFWFIDSLNCGCKYLTITNYCPDIRARLL
jgi:hypothetical protein